MNPKMRRNFPGGFLAQDAGHEAWRLIATPSAADIFITAAELNAAQAFGKQTLTDLAIEWHADAVLLSFMSNERVQTVEAASVIIHEPLSHLYDDLPLLTYDAQAQRLWSRIFRLLRVPGGRYLLDWWTRSRMRTRSR